MSEEYSLEKWMEIEQRMEARLEEREEERKPVFFEFKNPGDTIVGIYLGLRTVTRSWGTAYQLRLYRPVEKKVYVISRLHSNLLTQIRDLDFHPEDIIAIRFDRRIGKMYFYTVAKLTKAELSLGLI